MAIEIATGESLLTLQKSAALRDFEGVIDSNRTSDAPDAAPIADVHRGEWLPRRIVAIDASSITHKVKNGFPGAEASLLMLSVVFIDVSLLAAIGPDEIPSPRIFNEMDRAHTLDAVLPGANIVRGGVDGDTPINFFRKTAHDALSGVLDSSHETLLETLRSISEGRNSNIECPIVGCEEGFVTGRGEYHCHCHMKAKLFETDALRFHERFNERGSNGEVHGEVRRVIEVLSLVNILRFFEHDDRLHFLRDCAFILDGPLAVFGQPAWIAPHVRKELIRISSKVRAKFGTDILVMGVEKSGQYVSHFQDIDWSDELGPKGKFPASTVLIPDAKYINRNIVRRPEDAKPSGADTYFGRKIFYKNKSNAHATLNIAMVNSKGADFHCVEDVAFPRLNDALNILDHLSTYLYEDGFMPLVRAHAHAAIPLRRGTEILSALFQNV